MPLVKPTQSDVTQAFGEGLKVVLGGLQMLLNAPKNGIANQLVAEAEQILSQRFLNGPPAFPSLASLGLLGGAPQDFKPHRVFMLRLSDLAADASSVQAAVPTGWRLFAGSNPGETVLGRVAQSPQGSWSLASCSWGDSVWDSLQRYLNLDTLATVQAEDYELRLLEVPALNQQIFWLVAQHPGSCDLVAVNYPIPGLNTPGGTTTMANFLSVVGPLARQRTLYPTSHLS